MEVIDLTDSGSEGSRSSSESSSTGSEREYPTASESPAVSDSLFANSLPAGSQSESPTADTESPSLPGGFSSDPLPRNYEPMGSPIGPPVYDPTTSQINASPVFIPGVYGIDLTPFRFSNDSTPYYRAREITSPYHPSGREVSTWSELGSRYMIPTSEMKYIALGAMERAHRRFLKAGKAPEGLTPEQRKYLNRSLYLSRLASDPDTIGRLNPKLITPSLYVSQLLHTITGSRPPSRHHTATLSSTTPVSPLMKFWSSPPPSRLHENFVTSRLASLYENNSNSEKQLRGTAADFRRALKERKRLFERSVKEMRDGKERIRQIFGSAERDIEGIEKDIRDWKKFGNGKGRAVSEEGEIPEEGSPEGDEMED